MTFLRVVLAFLQRVWPGGAAWLTERLFFTAPRRWKSPRTPSALRGWRRFVLRVDGRRVVGWQCGADDAPIVYLAHGWGSRGARLAAFAAPLREAGYALVTFDAIGHGASGWGMSSMPEFARSLAAVVRHTAKGRAPHAIIAHSFGCSGTALALAWGLEPGRLVFLAPAADPPAWVAPFARALALQDGLVDRVRTRSERRIRHSWSKMNVCDIAGELLRHPPLLVIHDEGDRTVAWNDGAAITAAWPRTQGRMISTRGLGHRGVTSDPDIVRQVVEFVTSGETETLLTAARI
jgi:pimeloyl-ACP methyl ester carboxylesterase